MNLLIGVTASSGVMDLMLYLRVFREHLDADIKLVVTPAVRNFINPEFLKTFVQGNLYEEFLAGDQEIRVPHADLTKWADVFIVLPCTTNTLGKAANGIADNLLSMLLMYYPKPVIFFPNTNPEMWRKHSTQRNVRHLLEEGHRVVQPNWNGWETSTGQALHAGHMPPPYAAAEFIRTFAESQHSLNV